MNNACEICKGACCESFTIDLSGIKGRFPDDYRWLSFHGTQEPGGLRFDCACSKLKKGKCSIYDDRPELCKKYKVGSVQCLKAIATRRAHQQDEILKALKTDLG
jgi:Fe-S-cluster containining protein